MRATRLVRPLGQLLFLCLTACSSSTPYDPCANPEVGTVSLEEAPLGLAIDGEHCHGTFALTNSVTWEGRTRDELSYQNNALYNVDGMGGYPPRDRGLVEITHEPSDEGKFRPPTVRNVAVTAPYMHDGSIATLRAVIVEHYARGGRLIVDGPDARDGATSPRKASFVSGFSIAPSEVDDLVAFLEALTDDTFLNDPRLADPGT